MRHHLAVVACLALTGSFAHAESGRRAGHRDRDRDRDTEDRDTEDRDRDRDRIAFDVEPLDDDDLEDVDSPTRLSATARRARDKVWQVAVGPYLWASSVDANLSLGPASVSTGVDYLDLQRHARYGAEVLAEVRYRRFAIYSDVMYGVVAVDGSKDVGPLMVTVAGTASSLLVDGTAGYLVLGGDHSVLSVEARAGLRYQRTAVAGSVSLAGADVAQPRYVDAAADALVGAHVVLRPFDRLLFSGTADVGVYGASQRTWSASADASVRLTAHVLLSLGWRTLTTERPNVSIVMHGPRAALQLTF